MKDTVVEGSKNFDYMGYFSIHLNLSTQALNIFASISSHSWLLLCRTSDSLRKGNVPANSKSEDDFVKIKTQLQLNEVGYCCFVDMA